jgi:hypothetical protein
LIRYANCFLFHKIRTQIIRMIFKNRGTGAGGANTNRHGISYERITDLATEFTTIKKEKTHKVIHFNSDDNQNRNYVRTRYNKFKKYMEPNMNKDFKFVHGSKKPDECYIDEITKTIFIIEKKFQQREGSVCEKIQSAPCKIWNYENAFPDYKIVYTYTLSDWFKRNCEGELNYLEKKNIPVFWGSDTDYKSKMVDYITTYNSELEPL